MSSSDKSSLSLRKPEVHPELLPAAATWTSIQADVAPSPITGPIMHAPGGVAIVERLGCYPGDSGEAGVFLGSRFDRDAH